MFLRRLRGVSKPWLWSGETVYAGDFTLSLTLNLNLTDSPQYYDLPVLESTLECLVEMTAISGFSTASKLVDPKQLCVDILTSLLQVRHLFFRIQHERVEKLCYVSLYIDNPRQLLQFLWLSMVYRNNR